jgi:hypothetical protein
MLRSKGVQQERQASPVPEADAVIASEFLNRERAHGKVIKKAF